MKSTPKNPNHRSTDWASSLLGPLALVLALCLVLPSALFAAASAPPQGETRCDGLDDDGDGDIDEDFDTDGDGVARCCSKEPYFTTVDRPTLTQLTAHHRGCTDSAFTPSLTPIAEVVAPERIQVNGITPVTSTGTYAVLWTEALSRVRNFTFCNGVEWETIPFGHWDYNYFGGARIDSDNTSDLVGWDQRNSPVSGPVLGGGPDFGVSTLSLTFSENYSVFDTSPTLGAWVAARAYNLQDIDSDGIDDLAYHHYATGGPSSTEVYWLPGDGAGGFGPPNHFGTVGSQPQNFGDLGFVDDCSPDRGCADWIGGPDDDGDKGAIFASFGDCTGNFSAPVKVADVCPGATCPGSGSSHGSGMSQLFDWDCDGTLELLASHVVHTGSTASVTYFENDCGTFHSPVTVLNNQPILQTFATPLRN